MPRWKLSPPQILYDDENLRIVFRPGGSDWLVVTFGDAIMRADGESFYGRDVLEKLELNGLGFVPKAANWFPAESILAALPAISYTLRAFETRVFYGSSMGAYAAIKYSRLLGATHVVAYCPQWSIDPAECGNMPSGYEGFFRSGMAGMGIRKDDIGGSINVFYDPWHATDTWHFRRIEALSGNVHGFRVPHVGHHVVDALKGSAHAQRIWEAVRSGDSAHIYRVVNAARRPHGMRRQNLLARLARTDPMRAARLIASLKALGPLGLPHPPAVFLPLLKALVQLGERGVAQKVLEFAKDSLSETRRQAILHQLGSPQKRARHGGKRLITAHGTRLCYCAIEGRLVHAAEAADKPETAELLPVFVQGWQGFSTLAVRIGAAVLACAVGDHGGVDLVRPGHGGLAANLRATRRNAGEVVVTIGERYLCAEPGGRICYDRDTPGPWEVFAALDS